MRADGGNCSSEHLEDVERLHSFRAHSFQTKEDLCNTVAEVARSLTQAGLPKQKAPWYVFTETSHLRQSWNVVLILLLSYTGTVFPYRLCFVDSKINDEDGSDSTFWKGVELVIDILFYIDLVVWFFFTYRDRNGKEVVSLHRIAKNYLTSFFFINLIACIPSSLFKFVVKMIDSGSGALDVNKMTRLSRFQRVSRLVAQAMEFARLIMALEVFKKVLCFSSAGGHVGSWLHQKRYVRVINLIFALIWTVHLVACGWYIVASFQDDYASTWVGRRGIVDASSFDQWIQANYFVLTVFTTVGFGDIFAVTRLEAIYACFAMILGTLMQSLVMGEVMNIVTHVDQRTLDMKAQKELLKSFTDHAGVDELLSRELLKYLDKSRSKRHRFERDNVKVLLTSNDLPRELMALLSDGLFNGELVHNRFITTCTKFRRKMPPRFPLLIALLLNERHYEMNEMVYLAEDHPWTLFLVIEGTFAYVAYPTQQGGLPNPPLETWMPKTSPNTPTNARGRRRRISIGFMSHQSEHQQARIEREATQTLSSKLFPYQLFGPRTYFGDIELLLPDVKARFSSARCETESGRVLELSREDLAKMMTDFRTFAHIWRRKARRREDQRKYALWKLQGAVGNQHDRLQHFAALTIQRFWRYGHGGDSGRQQFIISALEDVGKEDKQDPEDGDEYGDAVADLTEELARMRHDVVSVHQELSHKVASIERTQEDVQQKVATIEQLMVTLTSLLAQHLGVQLPANTGWRGKSEFEA